MWRLLLLVGMCELAACNQRRFYGPPYGGDAPLGGGDTAWGDTDGADAGDAGLGGDDQHGDVSPADDGGGDSDPGDADPGDSGGDPGGGGELWLEIDYEWRSPGESTSTTDWSYSPGFGAAPWAPASSSWPYIHTPDGGALVSDPIGGTVLELGCNARLRIFFGLEELSAVASATVTVEGRSRATSSGVDFEVWNPGAAGSLVSYGSMSQDWEADVVTVAFTAEPGNGFQAVEIAPVARSCSLAVRRVRLTLHE